MEEMPAVGVEGAVEEVMGRSGEEGLERGYGAWWTGRLTGEERALGIWSTAGELGECTDFAGRSTEEGHREVVRVKDREILSLGTRPSCKNWESQGKRGSVERQGAGHKGDPCIPRTYEKSLTKNHFQKTQSLVLHVHVNKKQQQDLFSDSLSVLRKMVSVRSQGTEDSTVYNYEIYVKCCYMKRWPFYPLLSTLTETMLITGLGTVAGGPAVTDRGATVMRSRMGNER